MSNELQVLCVFNSGNACAEVYLWHFPVSLADCHTGARQESGAYGGALSPSVVFTACILSAKELVLVQCGLL